MAGRGQSTRSVPIAAHQLVIKTGRFGEFISCSNYPECKYSRPTFTTRSAFPCPDDRGRYHSATHQARPHLRRRCSNFPKPADWAIMGRARCRNHVPSVRGLVVRKLGRDNANVLRCTRTAETITIWARSSSGKCRARARPGALQLAPIHADPASISSLEYLCTRRRAAEEYLCRLSSRISPTSRTSGVEPATLQSSPRPGP